MAAKQAPPAKQENELPVKTIPKVKSLAALEETEAERSVAEVEYFGEWQTEIIILPAAENVRSF